MDSSAEKGVPHLNQLVDWLDGLDTEVLRSRRYLFSLPKTPISVVVISLATIDILQIALFGNVGEMGSLSSDFLIER
jgi:hypothetical protein